MECRLVLFILILFETIVSCDSKQREVGNGCDVWVDSVSGLLRSGDICMRRGTGIASHVVVHCGGKSEDFSHCGIVVKEADGNIYVCHAVPDEGESPDDSDRVRLVPISDFYGKGKAVRGAVFRVACSDSIAGAAALAAKEKWRLNVAFDHAYKWDDTTRLYCTQLVAMAYMRYGVDLVETRCRSLNVPGFCGDYVFPSDIVRSRLVEMMAEY